MENIWYNYYDSSLDKSVAIKLKNGGVKDEEII